ncbi:MAG TPA: hypothetical protein VLK65_17635 [Vicinamibacteria bacterium]|nr:hypothetical protein [Vicinamibacteria bacterium]
MNILAIGEVGVEVDEAGKKHHLAQNERYAAERKGGSLPPGFDLPR